MGRYRKPTALNPSASHRFAGIRLPLLLLAMLWGCALLSPTFAQADENPLDIIKQAAGLPTSSEKTEKQESNTPQTNSNASTPASNPLYASPRRTMESFLNAMDHIAMGDPSIWAKAVSTMDFSDMTDVSAEQKRRLARQLYYIITFVDNVQLADIPDKNQAKDIASGQWTFFPKRLDEEQDRILFNIGAPVGSITLSRQDSGSWLFDKDTVDDLPDLFNQLKRDAPGFATHAEQPLTWGDEIEHTLINTLGIPRSIVQGEFLGLQNWQWLGLLLLIIIGLAADQVVRFVLKIFIYRKLRHDGSEIKEREVGRSVRPFGMLVAAVFWLVTLGLLNLSGIVVVVLLGILQVFVVLAAVMTVWRLIDLAAAFLSAKAATTGSGMDDVLVPLLRKSLKIFTGVMGVIYAADALNIPIGPLLASVGVGAVAFSFAAKDTVENFFGSVAVLMDRPFDIGDWVVVDSVEGTVEELGFRSTRIRTFYNSQVTIPNANLVRAVVDNYGRRKYRRWSTMLDVQYDTTPDQIIAFTEGIRELVRTHPYTRKDYFQVRANGFADSAFQIMLYVFVRVDDWSMELRERERLMLDIIRLADQLGVQFAFPTRTVHLFQEQAGDHPTRFKSPGRNDERRSQLKGIRAAQQLVADQRWVTEPPGPVEFPEGPTEVDEDGHIDAADITEDTKPQDLAQYTTDTSTGAVSEEPETKSQPPLEENPEKLQDDDNDRTLRNA